jgi:hypothetical protein
MVPSDLTKETTKPNGRKVEEREAMKMCGEQGPEIGGITGEGGARV